MGKVPCVAAGTNHLEAQGNRVSTEGQVQTFQQNEMPTESTSEDCQTDMSEQGSAKKLCAKAKRKFTQAISNLDLAMTAKVPITAIESRYYMLKVIWKEVQGKHDAYVKLLPGDEHDEKWTEELNQTFSEMEVKTDSYLEESNAAKAKKMELKIGKDMDEAKIHVRSHELAEISKEEENEKARIKAKEQMEELLAHNRPGRN